MAKKKKRGDREAEKRRAAFLEQQRRLKRRRTIVGALGFLPLAAAVFGCTGGPLDVLCLVPREVWMLLWAALFGSFLGLTIRLVLERRRFDRATPDRPPA
ncbi:MAG: hypothetical protein AAB295_04450 [Chloroflexota bacterium]